MKRKTWYSLYDRLLHRKALENAFKKVRSANGNPGIDGVFCKDYAQNLDQNIMSLLGELKEKRYRPDPVKRVTIDKPGGGTRLIGIPTVRDRVVQQALKNILEPIFDPDFHPSSYGYRPGRSPHDAIAKAEAFMRRYDLVHVVDMDLSRCFDTLNHDLIIQFVRERVTDRSILSLIRMFLESGVMNQGVYEPTTIGSPQGGVISPLLANIYLDRFDQFMMARGHRIVRYADDTLIFKASESGAKNALQIAQNYLEQELKLTVNQRKTKLTSLMEGVDYLGVTILPKWITIQEKKLKEFKRKIKECTKRNSPGNLERVIRYINPMLRGFVNYFRVANCKKKLGKTMAWIRRRLRAIQLKLWKKPRKLHRRLRQLGYRGDFQCIRLNSWRNSNTQLSHWAMPNRWFKELGLYEMDKVITGKLPPINRG